MSDAKNIVELMLDDDTEKVVKTLIDNSAAIQAVMCPNCGRSLTKVTAVDEKMNLVQITSEPQVGALQVCVGCGQVNTFENMDGRMGLRKTTSDELEQLPPEDQKALALVKVMVGLSIHHNLVPPESSGHS